MRFDWAALMRAGFREAGLAPEVFWRLTPVELLMVLGVESGAAPLTRARLTELSQAFPDGGAPEALSPAPAPDAAPSRSSPPGIFEPG